MSIKYFFYIFLIILCFIWINNPYSIIELKTMTIVSFSNKCCHWIARWQITPNSNGGAKKLSTVKSVHLENSWSAVAHCLPCFSFQNFLTIHRIKIYAAVQKIVYSKYILETIHLHLSEGWWQLKNMVLVTKDRKLQEFLWIPCKRWSILMMMRALLPQHVYPWRLSHKVSQITTETP